MLGTGGVNAQSRRTDGLPQGLVLLVMEAMSAAQTTAKVSRPMESYCGTHEAIGGP